MPHAMPQAARRRCNLPDTVQTSSRAGCRIHLHLMQPRSSHAHCRFFADQPNHDSTRLSAETADASPLAPLARQARPTRRRSILSFLWPSAFTFQYSDYESAMCLYESHVHGSCLHNSCQREHIAVIVSEVQEETRVARKALRAAAGAKCRAETS